jgi:glucose-6-phosphate isomerase
MPKIDVRYEYRGALASTVGRDDGLTDPEWADLGIETSEIVGHLNENRKATPYRNLPTDGGISQANAILASVRKKAGQFDDLVVLGIGGSALGLIALKTALRPPYWNLIGARARGGMPRLWIMDNVDPDEFTAMLETIDPRRTLFNIISKSGETSETMSQFLVALELVRECVGKDWKRHIVIPPTRPRASCAP